MFVCYYPMVLCCVTCIAAQNCFPRNETEGVPGALNKRLTTYQMSHLMEFTLARCVLECLLVKMCKSFNHKEVFGICELNYVNMDEADRWKLKNTTGFVYHDIRNWNSEIASTCSSRPCGENQRCVRTDPPMCIDIDCGAPPRYLIKEGNPPALISIEATPGFQTSIGSVTQYSCIGSWAVTGKQDSDKSYFLNLPLKVCGSDAQWSTNIPKCLSMLDSCEKVRVCNPAYGDGHYWIYKSGFFDKKAKVYCHDMTGVPKTYVTLPHGDNVAYDAGNGTGPSMTVVSKVRINVWFTIDPSDFTFASSTGGDVPFGEAASCLAGDNDEKVYGYFKINTSGTGLILRERRTVWLTSKSGSTELVNLAYNGQSIRGDCWGLCGRCFSDYMNLELYSKEEIVASDTIEPICVE